MRAVVRTTADLQRFVDRVVDKLDGKPYTVTIKRFHRPRTFDQNAKFHGMIRDLAEYTGYAEAELKDIVKRQYLPMKALKIGKHKYEVPKSTTELTVAEMADLIERLYQIGHEVGCLFQGDVE
jgi:hypothetical protein